MNRIRALMIILAGIFTVFYWMEYFHTGDRIDVLFPAIITMIVLDRLIAIIGHVNNFMEGEDGQQDDG